MPWLFKNRKFHGCQFGTPLGKGKRSEVYEAEYEGQRFAGKITPVDKLYSLVRELDITCRNHHQNLVYTHHLFFIERKDFAPSDTPLYDEYCVQLIDLAVGDIVKRADNPKRFEEIFSSIGSALVFLHDNGISHMDVKPANILCMENGNYLLSDFELAVIRGRVKQSSGTPNYMAPEMLFPKGSKERISLNGVLCDSYSFGITMLYVAIGKTLGELTNAEDLPTLQKAFKEFLTIWTGDQEITQWLISKGMNQEQATLIAPLIHPDPTQRKTIRWVLGDRYYSGINYTTQPKAIPPVCNEEFVKMLSGLKGWNLEHQLLTVELLYRAYPICQVNDVAVYEYIARSVLPNQSGEEKRSILSKQISSACSVLVALNGIISTPTFYTFLTNPVVAPKLKPYIHDCLNYYLFDKRRIVEELEESVPRIRPINLA